MQHCIILSTRIALYMISSPLILYDDEDSYDFGPVTFRNGCGLPEEAAR